MIPPHDADRLFAAPIVEYLGAFSGFPADRRAAFHCLSNDELEGWLARVMSDTKDSGVRLLVQRAHSELMAWRVVERARLQRS